MTPEQEKLLKETYQLAYDNNKMLRSAKRVAFVSGLIKTLMYAAFIILPVYFFYTTIVPLLNDTAKKVNSVSSKVQGASDQVKSVQDTINNYSSFLGGGVE